MAHAMTRDLPSFDVERFRVPLRFTDIDAMGHVNHARYLAFCEEHRTRMFARMDSQCSDGSMSVGAVVARLECNFYRQIFYDYGEVEVACSVTDIGRSSFTLRYQIRGDSALCAELLAVIVRVDKRGQPQLLTPSQRAWLKERALPRPDPSSCARPMESPPVDVPTSARGRVT